MREVLYDLHRTDAAIQVAGYNYGHNETLGKYYYTTLQKHGITQEQFDSSLVWYTDNPNRFRTIYPRVISRLEADLQQVRAENMTLEERRKTLSASQLTLEQIMRQTLFGIDLNYPPSPDTTHIQPPFKIELQTDSISENM